MSSCDPATGCGPKTHNIHCSYPNCDMGRAKSQAAVKPAVVLLGDTDPTTVTIAGVTYESNKTFGWLRRSGTERHRMSRPGCQWLDHIAGLQQQLATARELLEGVEWVQPISNSAEACSSCGNMRHWGHAQSCELANYLKEVPCP